MGCMLLQWTYAPANRTAPLNEFVLTRVLEHYGLSQPIRSTVQLRTFRTPDRTLTTVTYLPTSPIAYLVVDVDSALQTLAVQPAASVIPLLTNLLSPFVMGLTKQARAAASTTAETARPTPLPGTALLLTSITFSSPITLSVHNLPSPSATTIFLEAEGGDEAELRMFLEGCLPEGLGEKKFAVCDDGPSGKVQSLVKLLRASGIA